MSEPTPLPEPTTTDPAREELLSRIASLEQERDHYRAEVDSRAGDGMTAPGHSGERFRSMADASPAMLWTTDSDNRCTFLSRQWYEATGQAEEEGLGFGWLQAVHPDDREAARLEFLESAARLGRFSSDFRLRRANGEYRWVIDEGRPHFGEHGEWLGYIGYVIDIHDRKVASQALRKSEERYRTLFESIDEGFCVLDMIFDEEGRPVNYRFLEANPAFEKQTGLQDAVGRTIRDLLPDLEEEWFEIYGRVATTGRAVRFEQGSEVMQRWFDVFAFRVEEPEKRRVALLFTDISDYKQAEDERKRLLRETEHARKEAEDANRAKSEFLAAMSHELRTPLNAIGGYVDLMQMEIQGPLTSAQRDALARIEVNKRHLLTHINDILSFAKVEAGRIEFDLRPLSATEVLSSMEPLISPQAEAKGIAYTMEGSDRGIVLRGDPERVRQVLLNLIGNAIKYTPEDGWVMLSCDADDQSVRLRVRDSGVGIPDEEMERIFDAFQQVGRRLNQPGEGVGLGLAISRDLARAMDGDLTVESVPGKGSTFTLRLPRASSG